MNATIELTKDFIHLEVSGIPKLSKDQRHRANRTSLLMLSKPPTCMRILEQNHNVIGLNGFTLMPGTQKFNGRITVSAYDQAGKVKRVKQFKENLEIWMKIIREVTEP